MSEVDEDGEFARVELAVAVGVGHREGASDVLELLLMLDLRETSHLRLVLELREAAIEWVECGLLGRKLLDRAGRLWRRHGRRRGRHHGRVVLEREHAAGSFSMHLLSSTHMEREHAGDRHRQADEERSDPDDPQAGPVEDAVVRALAAHLDEDVEDVEGRQHHLGLEQAERPRVQVQDRR